MPSVIVRGGFDDLRARDIRFLEEAAKIGAVTVQLASDAALAAAGRPPKFPFAERAYFLSALRHVRQVLDAEAPMAADVLVEREITASEEAARLAKAIGAEYRTIAEAQLDDFPAPAPYRPAGGKKVVVTGCYDWFHSGHVRFFEEASAYGELTVCLGNDACICELKGAGHPLIGQDERRYVVGSIKYVAQALISRGMGWLDADAEIRALKPDIYAVNEDGDKGGKRDYCRELGIAFLVLKRVPAPGLPRRSSTDLRGF